MEEFDWLNYGNIVASSHRKTILVGLKRKPATPKELSGIADLPMSHVSKALKELMSYGLVVCLTPRLRKGRVFGLTPTGKQIAQQIDVG